MFCAPRTALCLLQVSVKLSSPVHCVGSQAPGQTLAQAAQGGGGVPIPGGVQKTCRCGTWASGLVCMVVLG